MDFVHYKPIWFGENFIASWVCHDSGTFW